MTEPEYVKPRAIRVLEWMRKNHYEWCKIRERNVNCYNVFKTCEATIVFIHSASCFRDMINWVEAELMEQDPL